MEVTVLGSFAEGGRGVWRVVCGVGTTVDARAEKTGVIGTVARYGTDGVSTVSHSTKGGPWSLTGNRTARTPIGLLGTDLFPMFGAPNNGHVRARSWAAASVLVNDADVLCQCQCQCQCRCRARARPRQIVTGFPVKPPGGAWLWPWGLAWAQGDTTTQGMMCITMCIAMCMPCAIPSEIDLDSGRQ